MKIQVIIPIWKRPEVTKLCFDYLKELIGSIPYDVNVLCVISEAEYVRTCRSYGFDFIFFSNDNLGDKINAGIKYSLDNYQYDYLMMMNSDSIIKPELFEVYKPYFEKQEKFFGVNKVTFVNFYTDEAKDYVYQFSIIGPAKMVHRSIVEKMNGKLYKSLNKCLDDTMMDNLRPFAAGRIVEYEGQLVYDVKSDVNIHPWEKFNGRKVENELCSKVA